MTHREPHAELTIPELDEIRGGSCSAGLLGELKTALQVSEIELAGVVGIPRQTMRRRWNNGALKPDEADRAVAVAKAYNKALDFFDRNREAAVRWMKHPNVALGGNTPLECASTVAGANEVIVLLQRIEHGIPL